MRNKQDIYREALRLYKITLLKRKKKRLWQRMDYSHLPTELFDDTYVKTLSKITAYKKPEYCDFKTGVFTAYINPMEALVLVLVSYCDVDLDNYLIGASTYNIYILNENN